MLLCTGVTIPELSSYTASSKYIYLNNKFLANDGQTSVITLYSSKYFGTKTFINRVKIGCTVRYKINV